MFSFCYCIQRYILFQKKNHSLSFQCLLPSMVNIWRTFGFVCDWSFINNLVFVGMQLHNPRFLQSIAPLEAEVQKIEVEHALRRSTAGSKPFIYIYV